MKLEKVYLRRRRPCFICSHSLRTVTTGAHKGEYSAVKIVRDGYERLVHEACADDESVFASWYESGRCYEAEEEGT